MKYKLKPMAFVVEEGEEVIKPDVKDRLIEKRGEVVEFTLSDVELNFKEMNTKKKELEGKRDFEKVKKENIEQHHPFVLELSEQDLFTAWMYKEAVGWVTLCEEKIKLIDEQIASDEKEIAEIKSQIPELADIESPYGPEQIGTDK